MPFPRLARARSSRSGRRTVDGPRPPRAAVVVEPMERRVMMDGTYDGTWNNGGQLSLLAPGGGTALTATVVTQPDDRAILAGIFKTTGGTYETVVTRRTATGGVDTSFNGGNDVVLDFDESGITLQPDGKILVAGSYLERLNEDGSVDTTFGGGTGRIALNVPQGNVAVQPDGKILVSGTTSGGLPEITRYNADGSVDNTYGDGNGTKVLYILGGGAAVYSAGADAVTSSGDAVVAFAVNGNPSLATFGVVELTASGQFDTSFGLNGVSETAGYSEPANIGGVAIDSVGTIYAVGNYDEGSATSAGYLLAFSADGTHADISPAGGLDTIASTVVLGVDNKPVVVGTTIQGSGAAKQTLIAVNRFDPVDPRSPDWVPDPSWGGAGLVEINYNGPNALDSTSVGDLGGAVSELADGRIIFAGVSANPGTSFTSFNLTRLLGTPSIADGVGAITGLTYDDANDNGMFDSGEAGLPGYGVFIDANGNGVLDADETEIYTDENGIYTFDGLAPGTYTIVQTFPNGFTHTQPTAGQTASYTVTVAADQTIYGENFGLT